ncbi:hypothetical protein OEZ85_009639 [Tetradesmus obliquus]|uniref:Pherophorin domain-containing protein n=1 Tax=Tetradesmus obliquus TaxID=3088 RepID=A0ABY8U9X6_TETOB|nr:hypothetical protein OEZ85_009639 [Tetradesmus obliquus]
MPTACVRQPRRCQCSILHTLAILIIASVLSVAAHSAGNRVGGPDNPAAGAAQLRSLLGALNTAESARSARDAASKRVQVVPQCYWNPEEKVCDAEDAVNIMYAINARPGSAYLWFLLMTYDRETAPLALHCPGSKAHALLSCMRMPSLAACAASKDCVVIPASADSSSSSSDDGRLPGMCLSRHVQGLDRAAMKKFTFEVALAEPSAVGSCDGACWMRQAMLCNRTTGPEACGALSFCRRSSSGLCTPRLYAQDNFGSSVQEYMGECVDVDNRKDCEGLRLRLTNKGAYGSWAMPRSPKFRCSVPSIGSLLGSEAATAAAAASAKDASKVVLEVGQREEQTAGMQAAAAAAAAAANAARLVSGRGPVMLKQIYFSDDQPQGDSSRVRG